MSYDDEKIRKFRTTWNTLEILDATSFLTKTPWDHVCYRCQTEINGSVIAVNTFHGWFYLHRICLNFMPLTLIDKVMRFLNMNKFKPDNLSL